MQKLLLYLLILTYPSFIFSQEEIPIPEDIPILEKLVTVDYEWEHIETVLNSISKQTGAVFSYNSRIINPDELVRVHAKQKSLRIVLNSFLDENIDFKSRGKYIILSKKTDKAGKGKEEKILIEGYITDPKTGEKLENATVYDKEHMISATTDEFGYFKLELSPSKTITQLHVAKAGYRDTIITRKQNKSDLISINLPDIQIFNDSTYSAFKNKLQTNVTDGFISVKQWANTVNLNDTFFRKYQVSVLPFISTNQLLGGKVINDYSINIFGGYVQGVRRFEIGGYFNIVRHDASFCQLAGWSNIVGGRSRGFQGAGLINFTNYLDGVQASTIINITVKDMRSCQLAGIGNIAGGKAKGIQAGGIFSLAKEMKGIQLGGIASAAKNISGCQVAAISCSTDSMHGAQVSGIINTANISTGIQVAGIINIANKSESPQVAGLINVVDSIKGVQISGIINTADKINGVQLAGLVNVANNVRGSQITSCINIAGNVNGTQLALLNFADIYEKGIPVSFFSFVRYGLHNIEISVDETQFANLAFKTGVRHLYNIFTVGIKGDQVPVWNYGYGLGSVWGKNEIINKNVEITLLQCQYNDSWSYQNAMLKIYIGLVIKFSPNISIAAGATYNSFLLDKSKGSNYDIFSKLTPYTIDEQSLDTQYELQSWIGGRIALRFF